MSKASKGFSKLARAAIVSFPAVFATCDPHTGEYRYHVDPVVRARVKISQEAQPAHAVAPHVAAARAAAVAQYSNS